MPKYTFNLTETRDAVATVVVEAAAEDEAYDIVTGDILDWEDPSIRWEYVNCEQIASLDKVED